VAGSASAALRVRESALFRPGRAIGVVTDRVPFAHASLGSADFLTVGIGRGFQVFDCKKLRLAYIGPRLNEKVRTLLCVGEVVLTALKADIVAWHKLVELGRFRGHKSAAGVLCAVGAAYLVSASRTEVLVWRLSDVGLEPPVDASGSAQKPAKCVLSALGRLETADDFGTCTAACHMPTYLHKVLLGSDSGGLVLWNVRTLQRVHQFRAHTADGRASSAVTCLQEVPNVLDLVAMGFASGRICILHAKEDRVVSEFDQTQGRVTALSFRTGASAPAQMVSGSPSGTLVVWDLQKRRAHHVKDAAHHGQVVSACFLPGQPLLFTSGCDNAIRLWVFDTPDGLPRLLQTRSGCPGACRWIGFYSTSDDKELIVGGGAGERGFVSKVSFIQDHQNAEYSQSALSKLPISLRTMQASPISRLPPVVDMAFCHARHYDWPAVISAHEGVAAAFIWSAKHQALAPKVLKPPEASPVSAVAISSCGNYAVVGLENGALHRFNLQSGLHRGSIPRSDSVAPLASAAGELDEEAGLPKPERPPHKKAAAVPPPRAHRGRVCGVSVTVSGTVLSVASNPKDCALRIWKLATHEAVAAVDLGRERPGAPSCLLLRVQGALAAVSLDDGALLLVDLHGQAVVRSFACGVPANSIAFSAEGRWLAAALQDGGLRIFDLPAARCIDSFVFAKPALSVCFSPSSAFMLTSHAKGNAIQVWTNKFLFDPSLSAPLLRPEPSQPIAVDEPGAPAEEESEDGGAAAPGAPNDGEEPAEGATARAVEPLEPELLTLSDVPPAKWLATLHLDLVKERNKPAEPPKPLPNAPFFLPSAHEGVTPRFAAPLDAPDGEGEEEQPASRVIQSERHLAEGLPMQELLRKGDFDGALAFLKAQTPSGVHLAIEALGPLAMGADDELRAGLRFFLHHLKKAHYADEVQAFLSLFLQAHSEEVAADAELRSLCAELGSLQERRWRTLDAQCQKVRCFLGMLTHTQSQW